MLLTLENVCKESAQKCPGKLTAIYTDRTSFCLSLGLKVLDPLEPKSADPSMNKATTIAVVILSPLKTANSPRSTVSSSLVVLLRNPLSSPDTVVAASRHFVVLAWAYTTVPEIRTKSSLKSEVHSRVCSDLANANRVTNVK